MSGEHPIHRPFGTEVPPLIEEGGVDLGWGEIYETWLVQHGEYSGKFLSAEGSRGDSSPGPVADGPPPSIVRRPGHAQRDTRERDAESRPELRDPCHQECSASSGTPSNTESFFCTSTRASARVRPSAPPR